MMGFRAPRGQVLDTVSLAGISHCPATFSRMFKYGPDDGEVLSRSSAPGRVSQMVATAEFGTLLLCTERGTRSV